MRPRSNGASITSGNARSQRQSWGHFGDRSWGEEPSRARTSGSSGPPRGSPTRVCGGWWLQQPSRPCTMDGRTSSVYTSGGRSCGGRDKPSSLPISLMFQAPRSQRCCNALRGGRWLGSGFCSRTSPSSILRPLGDGATVLRLITPSSPPTPPRLWRGSSSVIHKST